MRFSLLFSRSIFLFFFGCLPFIGNTRNLPESKINPIVVAEQLIEDGSINIAYLILVEHLKTKNLSKEVKYKVYKDLAKIHLYEQDLVNYEKLNRKAYELKKNEGEIYKGMYYAEKAFFWHFLTWADSATYYSNLSMDIIQKNRHDFHKISVGFVYQVYAVTFLYRKISPSLHLKDQYNTPIHRILMHQWFDSAIVYQKKFPFQFSSDKVMLYRGIGNRYVDAVSYYHFGNKSCQKTMTPLQWYSFKKAKEYYKIADKYTKVSNWNDRLLTDYMKGINYMSIGEKEKAKIVFNSILNCYFSVYKNIENSPNARLLINVISLKVTNDINLPYNEKNINHDIYLLKKLRNNWWEYSKQSAQFNYDTYNLSPNTHLYNLYKKKYLVSKNKRYLSLATSYYLTHLTNFRFFKDFKQSDSYRINNAFLELKQINNSYLKQKINKYIHLKSNIVSTAPFASITDIQKKLKVNEGIFLPVFTFINGSKKTYKVFITKNRIREFESRIEVNYILKDYDTISFDDFKKTAYRDYTETIKNVVETFPTIHRIFTLPNDFCNYETMIVDTSGSNYDELHYLSEKVQFISVYNLCDYFFRNQEKQPNSIDFVRLKNSNLNNLPFTNQLAKKSFPPLKSSFNDFDGKFANLLSKNGILHLYGHSQFNKNEATDYLNLTLPFQTKSKNKEIEDFSDQLDVSRSLIVLNNCFSGYSINSNMNEYNHNFYLKLLYNGALNVIVSPTKTDDESSSKIFHSFYQNIAKGQTTEDALYHAQIYYLKTNKGSSAHPKFWSPYKLISNYAYPIYTPAKSNSGYYLLFGLLFSLILAILAHLHVQMKHF